VAHRSRLGHDCGRNFKVLTLLVSVIEAPSTLGKNPNPTNPDLSTAAPMVSMRITHASSRAPRRSLALPYRPAAVAPAHSRPLRSALMA
jgi:hypothetical protein